MFDVEISQIDESFLSIRPRNGKIHDALRNKFRFRPPNYFFMPKYRSGLWDGYLYSYQGQAINGNWHNTLPKGFLEELINFCRKRHYTFNFTNKLTRSGLKNAEERTEKFLNTLPLPDGFEVRDYQKSAFISAISKGRILLESPTASGKSFLMYMLTRFYNQPTLIIVPAIMLANQLKEEYRDYSSNDSEWNVDEKVHVIFSGKEKETECPIVISTWQSIYKLPKSYFSRFRVIIADEVHSFEAKCVKEVIEKCHRGVVRIGVTGTIKRKEMKIAPESLEGSFGKVKVVTELYKLIEEKFLSDAKINVLVLDYNEEDRKAVRGLTYAEEVDWIVGCEKRINFVSKLAAAKRDTALVLFERKKHGKALHEKISSIVGPERAVYYIDGGTKPAERERIRKAVETQRGAVIVASIKVFAVGVNIENLYYLILAHPTKGEIRILQSVGRTLRLGDRSHKIFVNDIVDDLSCGNKENYGIQHYRKRLEIYESRKLPFEHRHYEADKYI